MAEEPLFVRSCQAPLVHPKPERELSTDVKFLEAGAETVDFKDNDAASLPAERTNSPLRPARFSQNSEDFEPVDKMIEDEECGTDTRKQIAGFFAKLGAGLKCLGFGGKTQKRQRIY